MLRIVPNSNAAQAKSYYSASDYYVDGQERSGVWRGIGANKLGLSGNIQRAEWDALCNGLNPQTGDRLLLRLKDKRTVGYDFNFHVPKSVSVLYAMTRDERIVDAFRASVDETMRDIETEMLTRVRKGGKNEERRTGNMVWGEFVHFTSPGEGTERVADEAKGRLALATLTLGDSRPLHISAGASSTGRHGGAIAVRSEYASVSLDHLLRSRRAAALKSMSLSHAEVYWTAAGSN